MIRSFVVGCSGLKDTSMKIRSGNLSHPTILRKFKSRLEEMSRTVGNCRRRSESRRDAQKRPKSYRPLIRRLNRLCGHISAPQGPS